MYNENKTTLGEGSLEFQRLDALSNDALDLFRLIVFIAAVYSSVAAFALQAGAFQDHLLHSDYALFGAVLLIGAVITCITSYRSARNLSMKPLFEDGYSPDANPAVITRNITLAAFVTFFGSYMLFIGLLDVVVHGGVPFWFAIGLPLATLLLLVPFKLPGYLVRKIQTIR